MNITDIVRSTKTKGTSRIIGFFRIEDPDGDARFRPCNPSDHDIQVISTYASGIQFHHPFDLELVGPADWDQERVEAAREHHRLYVEEDTWPNFTLKSHPLLLRRFLEISNHDRLRLAEWCREQVRLFSHQQSSGIPVGQQN